MVLFSSEVVSDYLWPHELQRTRLLCPSLSPGACSDSCPSSQWCHPTISSSVMLLPSLFPSIRVECAFSRHFTRVCLLCLASFIQCNVFESSVLSPVSIFNSSRGSSQPRIQLTVSKRVYLFYSYYLCVYPGASTMVLASVALKEVWVLQLCSVFRDCFGLWVPWVHMNFWVI